MAYANYRLHRIGGLCWRWVAEWHGESTKTGLALSERAARWAARSWLRSMTELDGRSNLSQGVEEQNSAAQPQASH